ncbi:MAG: preprotein translocase subunit SecG [Candidatus Cellulosilyticum pullistercoris]|uniref:Protein-export membrane protein SecG n=1 Tax=Candidatus Cellulosilyticum pullistercoris TaxID=2838521 RepID=A0A9E2NKW7_9FIRM|nr:preprotein translocase subunit SecG [Candidatus Cellulosilyticum pullistercoris]
MATLRILLIVIFLIAALAVTIIVLLQEGKSAGLGSIGGTSGGGDSYWDKNRKHSLEGKFEKWTKITACVFVLSAFVLMFIPNSNSSSTTNNGTGTEVVQPTESAPADEATNTTDNADTAAPSESPEATGTTESPAASETPAQ